jgi:hypothetical protein
VYELPEIPLDWEDISWHNDACPSWQCGDKAVFIDYLNPEDRKYIGSYRYSVHDIDSCSCLFKSNDWDDIKHFVKG